MRIVEEHGPHKTPLAFFRTDRGIEPVREWLKALPESERHAIGSDLLRAQWRWPVGMPLCRAMGEGLWEIKNRFADKAHGSGSDFFVSRPSCSFARLHQENENNAG